MKRDILGEEGGVFGVSSRPPPTARDCQLSTVKGNGVWDFIDGWVVVLYECCVFNFTNA